MDRMKALLVSVAPEMMSTLALCACDDLVAEHRQGLPVDE